MTALTGDDMKLYKLTDAKGQTYNETQWGPGVEHTASGKGALCTAGWLHAYVDPLLAVFLDPAHGNFVPYRQAAQLWEAEGDVRLDDVGLKVGCTRLMTVRTIPLPAVTDEQRIAFAIRCALKVFHGLAWVVWAEGWLSGEDCSAGSASVAWEHANADRSIDAARAGLYAAWSVVYSPHVCDHSANAAVHAAHVKPLDLISIAKGAMK